MGWAESNNCLKAASLLYGFAVVRPLSLAETNSTAASSLPFVTL